MYSTYITTPVLTWNYLSVFCVCGRLDGWEDSSSPREKTWAHPEYCEPHRVLMVVGTFHVVESAAADSGYVCVCVYYYIDYIRA